MAKVVRSRRCTSSVQYVIKLYRSHIKMHKNKGDKLTGFMISYKRSEWNIMVCAPAFNLARNRLTE